MELSSIYTGLGEEAFGRLLRSISIGKLKTYQLFERMKIRLHLPKMNAETLQKARTRLWARLVEDDKELANDLAQSILVCHLDMIIAVLNFLGIPHEEGFFAKETDVSTYLLGDWQKRAYVEFKEKYSPDVLAFYLNHLAAESVKDATFFNPAA